MLVCCFVCALIFLYYCWCFLSWIECCFFVLKKYFLSERKFFFCVCFLFKMLIVVFLFMIWFCVFFDLLVFILGLLVLFYVFGDLFILLFDWLKLFCVDVKKFVCSRNLKLDGRGSLLYLSFLYSRFRRSGLALFFCSQFYRLQNLINPWVGK